MTTSAPTLVVLAAGMSSRFNKDAAPGDAALKQVVGFGPHGETILDYSVFDALRAGFQKAVFVIRREFESEFRRNVTDKFAGAIAVDFAFQEIDDIPRHLLPADFTAATRAKPWGTGHAVLASRHVVNEPVGVINADDFYGRSSFEKLAGFLRQPDLDSMPCRNCMVGFPMRPTLSDHGRVARGVCTVVTKTQIQSGRPRTAAVPGDIQLLKHIEELTDLVKTPTGAENRPAGEPPRSFTGDELVSLNIWGFAHGIFSNFERVFANFLRHSGRDPKAEFYIPFALDQLIREGAEQCRVLRSDAQWFGVTYRDDVPAVRTALDHLHHSGGYPKKLWA
jgi:hypothetical protein